MRLPARRLRRRVSRYAYLVRPRRLHAYCVGTGRSGTKSFARIFETEYRSAHEPEALQLIHLQLELRSSKMNASEVRSYLRRRDKRLWLEFESSQLAGRFAHILADELPTAKFILTIRDPFSWLESLINHELRAEDHPVWRRRSDLAFDVTRSHPPEEHKLRVIRPYTLGGYLSYWRRHNMEILDRCPPDRLMVVRTNEIHGRLPAVATFLGIDPDTLDLEKSHANRAPHEVSLLSLVSAEYLDALVEEHCGSLMAQFYPGTLARHALGTPWPGEVT